MTTATAVKTPQNKRFNEQKEQFCTCVLRPWETRTHCCRHIVAHDVSWAAQTGKHLLRTQNVSEQNQSATNGCGHRQTGKLLCRQQCVRNNVSSFARAFKFCFISLPSSAKHQSEMTKFKVLLRT